MNKRLTKHKAMQMDAVQEIILDEIKELRKDVKKLNHFKSQTVTVVAVLMAFIEMLKYKIK